MAKRKKRKRSAVPVAICTVVLLVAVAVAVWLIGRWSREVPDTALPEELAETEETLKPVGENQAVPVETNETESSEPKLVFPIMLEDGKLEVTSLFQFAGFNPDCGLEEGTDIASLAVRNCSREHLAVAELTATLSDGTEAHFTVWDLPAGQSALLFSTENAICGKDVRCTAVTGSAEFEADPPLLADKLTVSVEETAVTVTNESAENLNHLVVYCHCLMDGDYFGGVTYSYPVEALAAGESMTFQAEDCYLGEAAVVRITLGN